MRFVISFDSTLGLHNLVFSSGARRTICRRTPELQSTNAQIVPSRSLSSGLSCLVITFSLQIARSHATHPLIPTYYYITIRHKQTQINSLIPFGMQGVCLGNIPFSEPRIGYINPVVLLLVSFSSSSFSSSGVGGVQVGGEEEEEEEDKDSDEYGEFGVWGVDL